MTFNPFAPTFRPHQRPKLYSFNRPKTLVVMDSSEPSDFPATGAKAYTANSRSPQIEEQIRSLSFQLNQLQTYSESSIQQTTPLLQKFQLAHLKQVQYLHSVQFTVAKLHQDLESEKLERQTLQLLVLQIHRDLTFTQNTLMNQKTGTPLKQFSIDPPSAGTVTNLSVPETHELLPASVSQIILMGDSKSPKSSALTSSPILCQSSSNIQSLHSAASLDIVSKFNALEKQTKDDLSRQKSLLSSIQSNYFFCMTRFANWKPAATTQSYGGYHRYDSSSIQQNQPNASLNLLLIKLLVTGVLFSELISMAEISSSDFTLMELTPQPDNLQPSSLPFFLGTTTVFYVGLFLKLVILASATSLTHSMRGCKRCNPHKNPPSDEQHLLSRMTHSLLPSTNTSHTLNFSAKLMDTLYTILVILKYHFLTQLCRNHVSKNFHFLPFPRTPQSIFISFNWGELSR